MQFIGFMEVGLFFFWLWDKHAGLVIVGTVLLVGTVIYFIAKARQEAKEYQALLEKMSPEERERHEQERRDQLNTALFGPINALLVCPHCTTTGQVRSKAAIRSVTSVSNTIAKVSATTTRQVTQRHCDKCQTTWDV